ASVKPNFSVYDSSDQSRCIKQAVKDCQLDASQFSPARMLDAISTLKNKLLDPKTFREQSGDFFSKILAKIYEKYQKNLTDSNSLDFDDLLMKTAVLLRDNPDICIELGRRFRFLMIDEYQDTNHAQYSIARYLVSSHNNIRVTGDPDQSIYRWRGADIRNIMAFEKDWPNATVVKLEENFRSTPNILAAADNLILSNKNRKPKRLIATRAAGTDIAISAFEDEREEAQALARQVGELTSKGVLCRDISVFYRVNSMSRVLEEALINNRIPYQIVRGIEFYGRKEIKDVLAYLKTIANPEDEIALLRIINTPARGIGKATIDRVKDYAVTNNISLYQAMERIDRIETLGKGPNAKIAVFVKMLEEFKKGSLGKVSALIEKVFTDTGLEADLMAQGTQGTDATDNVNELINSAAQYDEKAEEPSLVEYIQQIALFSDADAYDASSDRIALMTLHAAKGLEFDNVFIIGVEEGLLPHERSSENEEETEEERRLFFVGITRAKTFLHVSFCKYRTIRGQMLRCVPSQFLYELGIGFSAQTERSRYSYDDIDEQPEHEEFDEYTPPFSKNELVKHKVFGLGRIVDFVDMGEARQVAVKFNTGQTKTLMLKYANLTKV
ncbi:MAG: ATP-dependent DNA helicase PcrA, partial [Candidatus Brocadiia bacterium]